MRQSAYLVFKPIIVDNLLPSLIAPDGSGVRLFDGPNLKLFTLVGWGRRFLYVYRGSTELFFSSGLQ